MAQKKEYLKLITDVLDDISNDTNIEKMCNMVTESVPNKFSMLSECGLLNNLLKRISTSAEELNNNISALKMQIETHKENVVNCEYMMCSQISNLENISVSDSLITSPATNLDTSKEK